MRILGNVFFAVAGLCFLGAAVALAGFVAGGIDAIDGGRAGALIAYVPVALACGLVGTIAWASGDALRSKGRDDGSAGTG